VFVKSKGYEICVAEFKIAADCFLPLPQIKRHFIRAIKNIFMVTENKRQVAVMLHSNNCSNGFQFKDKIISRTLKY
jgi:uncharacterized protein (DUF362 family)